MIKKFWIESKSLERFSAYKYLKNANHEKYGNVFKYLRKQKGIRKDKFPKTMIDTINP